MGDKPNVLFFQLDHVKRSHCRPGIGTRPSRVTHWATARDDPSPSPTIAVRDENPRHNWRSTTSVRDDELHTAQQVGRSGFTRTDRRQHVGPSAEPSGRVRAPDRALSSPAADDVGSGYGAKSSRRTRRPVGETGGGSVGRSPPTISGKSRFPVSHFPRSAVPLGA